MARNMTPDQLDPLASSSSPISVEPSAGGADQEAIEMLVANGMPYSKAVAVVRAEKAKASADFQSRMDAQRAKRSPPPAPSAPEEEEVSAETIRQYGYMPQAEPGPTSVRGGGKVAQGQRFNKMSEAIDYMTRTPVTDANRAEAAVDAAYMPSPRDRNMMARGFFPVYAPDGSVSYSVGTGQDPKFQQDLGRRGIPGAPGRLGPRADLQEEVVADKPIQPGFSLQPVRGPTGTNYIYKQNEAAQKQQAGYMNERQIARFADASGLTEAELTAMTPEQRRSAVRGAKRSGAQDREEAWRSQMMLAGRNPAKNAVNAYNALNDPGTNDWQRAVMANALRPDMDNTTPLTVDAMGAQNALRFLNSTNLGAAGVLGGGAAADALSQKARNDAKADFDAWHKKTIGGSTWLYTQDMHDAQVNYLMNQYSLSRPQAEAIAQSQGVPRVLTPPTSSPTPIPVAPAPDGL